MQIKSWQLTTIGTIPLFLLSLGWVVGFLEHCVFSSCIDGSRGAVLILIFSIPTAGGLISILHLYKNKKTGAFWSILIGIGMLSSALVLKDLSGGLFVAIFSAFFLILGGIWYLWKKI